MSACFSSRLTRTLLLAAAAPLFAASLHAADEKKDEKKNEAIAIADVQHDGPVDFQQEILPILRRNCLACHNATDAESDLVLETPQTILAGGSLGAAVIAGESGASLLLMAASHSDDPAMPPKDNKVGAKNLTPEQLGLIKLWIDQGAKGEVTDAAGPITWQPLPASVQPIYAIAVSPHGKYAAAGRANQVFIYSVPGKREVTRLTDPELVSKGIYQNPGVAHLDLVQSLAFSPDGKWLASGGYRTVKLWQRPENARKGELKGIEGEPKSLAVSPDGKWAAVGEAGGKVKLIELASGNVAKTLEGHGGPVSGAAFSADSSKLATGGEDKTARVWNIADGKELGKIETPAAVNAVAFALEDKQLATGGGDNIVRTWALPGSQPAPAEGEAKEGEPADAGVKPIKEMPGHGGAITSLVAVGPTAGQLLSGSQDGTLRLWDANGGNQLRQFNHGGPVTGVAISPDGKKVASASSNNSAKLFNFDNAQQIAEMKGDPRTRDKVEELTQAVALAKRHVDNAKQDLDEAQKRKKSEEDNAKKSEEAKTKAEGEFKQKDEAAKKPVADNEAAMKELDELKPQNEKAEADKAKAEEDAKKAEEVVKAAQEKVKAAGEDAAAKEAAQKELDAANEAVKAAGEARNKANQAFTDVNNKFKQAENKAKQTAGPAQKATDELNAAKRAMEAAVRSVERSAEAVKKATEAAPTFETALKGREEASKQREMEKTQADQAVPTSEKPVLAVSFTTDGTRVVTGGDDQLVHIWSAENGAAMEVYEGQAAPIKLLAATPSRGVIALGANASAIVWDTDPEWKLARTIGTADSPQQLIDRVTALHFSPDNQLLATGGGEPSRSGELKIWKVEDGSLVKEIKDAHSDTIFDLEFSPDGQYIASGAADRFMKVHEVATGNFVRAFEGHTHHVMGVSWRADGRLLASSGADQSVKVWDFQTGDQRKTITGYNKEVTAVKFVAASDDMITSSGDPQVSMRDSNGGNKGGFGGPSSFMFTARVSDDGQTFAAGGQDGIVRLWNQQKQPIVNFDPPKPPAAEENKQAAK